MTTPNGSDRNFSRVSESERSSVSPSSNSSRLTYEQLHKAGINHDHIEYQYDPTRQRLRQLQQLAADHGNPFVKPPENKHLARAKKLLTDEDIYRKKREKEVLNKRASTNLPRGYFPKKPKVGLDYLEAPRNNLYEEIVTIYQECIRNIDDAKNMNREDWDRKLNILEEGAKEAKDLIKSDRNRIKEFERRLVTNASDVINNQINLIKESIDTEEEQFVVNFESYKIDYNSNINEIKSNIRSKLDEVQKSFEESISTFNYKLYHTIINEIDEMLLKYDEKNKEYYTCMEEEIEILNAGHDDLDNKINNLISNQSL